MATTTTTYYLEMNLYAPAGDRFCGATGVYDTFEALMAEAAQLAGKPLGDAFAHDHVVREDASDDDMGQPICSFTVEAAVREPADEHDDDPEWRTLWSLELPVETFGVTVNHPQRTVTTTVPMPGHSMELSNQLGDYTKIGLTAPPPRVVASLVLHEGEAMSAYIYRDDQLLCVARLLGTDGADDGESEVELDTADADVFMTDDEARYAQAFLLAAEEQVSGIVSRVLTPQALRAVSTHIASLGVELTPAA